MHGIAFHMHRSMHSSPMPAGWLDHCLRSKVILPAAHTGSPTDGVRKHQQEHLLNPLAGMSGSGALE